MRLFNKAGDSVLVDPGSEAEKLWRAKGFATADEVIADDHDDNGDGGQGGNDGADGGSGEPDAAAASAAARIAAKKRGK